MPSTLIKNPGCPKELRGLRSMLETHLSQQLGKNLELSLCVWTMSKTGIREGSIGVTYSDTLTTIGKRLTDLPENIDDLADIFYQKAFEFFGNTTNE